MPRIIITLGNHKSLRNKLHTQIYNFVNNDMKIGQNKGKKGTENGILETYFHS